MHESRFSVSRTVTQPVDFNSLFLSVFMAYNFILESKRLKTTPKSQMNLFE